MIVTMSHWFSVLTCLLPATRITGSNLLGELMWNRDFPVGVVSLHTREFFETKMTFEGKCAQWAVYEEVKISGCHGIGISVKITWRGRGERAVWAMKISWRVRRPVLLYLFSTMFWGMSKAFEGMSWGVQLSAVDLSLVSQSPQS